MKLPAVVILLLCAFSATAQYITHGPVIGAVTSNTCKIYVRTATPADIKIEVTESPDYKHGINFLGKTFARYDSSTIIQISAMRPNTVYYYHIFVNGVEDTIRGHFRTFPKEGEKGDYTFVTGSCQETKNMKVFDAMPLNKPYFLMHTGDFTYPTYMIGPTYASTQEGIFKSYRRRYSEKTMKQMMYNLPLDYLYDDDDYVVGSGGRYCGNDWKPHREHGIVVNEFIADTFPPFWRRNVIKGYAELYPHYDLPDTSEGIFHSFKFGNAEFFVIDRNSDKAWPNSAAFKYDSIKKRLVFAPPPGYALFGKKQMDWLKQAMKNSTADWKFIISGIPLNGACKKLIDAGLKLQNLHYKNWYGFHMAWGFGQYWAAYPEERNDFMDFLKTNNIKNVIVISGDTHHCVMDDGTNAGLPELNASGLSVSTTELARYLKLIGNFTGLYHFKKIWNKGALGIGNNPHKNGFGKVRIVGDQYVELSIVNEDNKVVSSFQVPFKK